MQIVSRVQQKEIKASERIQCDTWAVRLQMPLRKHILRSQASVKQAFLNTQGLRDGQENMVFKGGIMFKILHELRITIESYIQFPPAQHLGKRSRTVLNIDFG